MAGLHKEAHVADFEEIIAVLREAMDQQRVRPIRIVRACHLLALAAADQLVVAEVAAVKVEDAARLETQQVALVAAVDQHDGLARP